ncbi:MAG: hypothetical protein JSW62_01980, partial [Thermoplasmatales archaeon]
MKKNKAIFIAMMLVLSATGALVFIAPNVVALVETGVHDNPAPAGCVLIDFEDGAEEQIISDTIPGLQFTTTYGIDWRYGEAQYYNVNPYGSQLYECNGDFFAWLGVTGDAGRIDFTEGTASYFSILVSTGSGVTVDAYDSSDVLIATSGWASSDTGTGYMTRLTISQPGMAYVIVHDTGNYWLMDDLVTDAPGVGVCLEAEKEIIDAEYGDPGDPLYFVPIFENAWWDLEITVDNCGYVDLEDITIYDSMGAKLDLVVQEGAVGEYIFKINGNEIPLGSDDEYKGEYDGVLGYIKWWQANKKYDPIKRPCATNIKWFIGDLDDGDEPVTLEFRVETIEFKAGPHTKQAFTSTCHHELNDGPVAAYKYDGEWYGYWGEPVIVSVYDDEDPEADSDSDGLYDWEEVTGEHGYITDPCNWDTDDDGYSDGEEIAAGNNPTD